MTTDSALDGGHRGLRVGLGTALAVSLVVIVLGFINIFMDSPEFGWTLVLVGVVTAVMVPVIAIAVRVQGR